MGIRLRRTVARTAVLGAVAALTVGTAAPTAAADPLWVTDPNEYWSPSRDCTHLMDSSITPGAGDIYFLCSSQGDQLTAWVKGKKYPMQWGQDTGNAVGFNKHWANWDCLALGTPVYIEGTLTHTHWAGGPTAENPDIPWEPVSSTVPYTEWDRVDPLGRAPLPARCGNPSAFTDIGPGNQYYEAIQWAATHGIVTGWQDGTYRPHAPITRDAMAAYLARWGKVPVTVTTNWGNSNNIESHRWTPTIRPPYRDVPAARQFSVEVSLLWQIGVIQGWSDGTYRSGELVTREATAAFLYRLAGSPAYTPPRTSPFTDVRPGDPFYKEITWMATSKFATGWPDRTFRPKTSIARDAMAAMLHRFDKVHTGANRYNGIVQ